MTPVDARHWIDTEMNHLFPVGLLRDTQEADPYVPQSVPWMDDSQLLALLEGKNEPVIETGAHLPGGTQRIQVAGFGGPRSALRRRASRHLWHEQIALGYLVALLWTGDAGGSAHVSVILSDEPVGSPLVERPDVLLAMSTPRLIISNR